MSAQGDQEFSVRAVLASNQFQTALPFAPVRAATVREAHLSERPEQGAIPHTKSIRSRAAPTELLETCSILNGRIIDVLNRPLPRLDRAPELREALLPYCRLRGGDVWTDPSGAHRVACIDATDDRAVARLVGHEKSILAIQDPPYNLVAFEQLPVAEYINWCSRWVRTTGDSLADAASLYVWLGADQRNGFQPLPDFMLMMRTTQFSARSFITLRNQRGYGTQANWMAVRQELLFYVRGKPHFDVDAEYTDIPKILRGYYKEVNGKITENIERSRSNTIRAGNVWVDIQQVFYRMEENVNGCYAQKPLSACKRVITSGSRPGELVIDFFAHSGSTLLASEMLRRKCYTADVDPVYCEIAIRRLEHFRRTGKTGWQGSHPFHNEETENATLARLISAKNATDATPPAPQGSLWSND